MTRYILPPAPPGSGSQWETGLQLPPLAPPGGTPCECADVGLLWFNETTMAATIEDALVPACFAASGTICPDTVWTLGTLWTGSGDVPTITEFAPGAWAVYSTDPGVLEIDATALCGGVSFTAPPIFLTVAADYYAIHCDEPPVEYTPLTTVIATGCVQATLHGVTEDIVFTEFDSILINDGPYYQGTPDFAATYLSFVGLDALFGDSDMDVRITVFSNDLANAGSYFQYVDNHNSNDDDISASATWEYTVASADINDWITGAGVGDGAGGTGSAEFQVEIRATPP